MTKIDIVSGFLGAGKTTLIKKMLAEAYKGEKLVLIENEFGEISIDGGFLKDAGVQISEMSSGCICCSLVGDFNKALKDVHQQFAPDRILIEPSGVGKLSEILAAVERAKERHSDLVVTGCATVVDAGKCRMYMKNFGEFFLDQIKTSATVIFSRTQLLSAERIEKSRALVEEQHPGVRIVTTPWDDLSADTLLEVIESGKPMEIHLDDDDDDDEDEHEHHHHHEDGEECCCHHHHDDDHDDHEHHHHHHDHDECCCGHDHDEEHEHHHHDHDDHDHCCCGHHHDHDDDDDDDEHEHHHDHDGHCCCGHHHHHHDHDADEVFTSWGVETARKFTKAEVEHALTELDTGNYGMILRSKGIVDGGADGWLEFDYVPGEWV